MYLTAKEHTEFDDVFSILQIIELAVADPAIDGITYLNKTAATVTTKAYGSYCHPGGRNVAIAITDNGTALMPQGAYRYDLKCLLADGSSQVLSAEADCLVVGY